jgi:hypothetical protein
LHKVPGWNVSDVSTVAGMTVTERPVQSPCQWCGQPVVQPPAGRLLRYCDRSCRQRAYEVRAARRRLGEDVDAGVVRLQPAERIVERVVRARYPGTPAGWVAALAELRAQLSDGRLAPWHAQRLQREITAVDEQLRAIAAGWPPSRPQSPVPRPRAVAVDERLAAAVADRITAAGGRLSITLERLAGELRVGVDVLRHVVLELEYTGLLVAQRMGNVVSVDELAVHARVELHASGR